MEIDDDDRFFAAMDAVAERGMAALQAGAEVVQEGARAVTPKLTGALAASIQVTVSGDEAAVHTSLPYAVKQHEKVGFKHVGGQAKYLETGLLANQQAALDAIAETLDLGS